MLSHRQYWALPIALGVGLTPGLAAAQALPLAEMNPVDAAVTLQLPASAASAPTFSQLSTTASKHTSASDDLTPAETSREGLWLPLAGAAALAFVARRNRRAFHPAPQARTESA